MIDQDEVKGGEDADAMPSGIRGKAIKDVPDIFQYEMRRAGTPTFMMVYQQMQYEHCALSMASAMRHAPDFMGLLEVMTTSYNCLFLCAAANMNISAEDISTIRKNISRIIQLAAADVTY